MKLIPKETVDRLRDLLAERSKLYEMLQANSLALREVGKSSS